MPDSMSDGHGPTIRREASDWLKRTRPRLCQVGMLSPIAGLARVPIRIEQGEVTIGRDPRLTASLPDDSVSRLHARIIRRGEEFILEDLGSFNGTHVDGVPVLSCLLHDGDLVQIGQNLFYFERVPEVCDAPWGEAP